MKFSIITATYKKPKELIRAVNSILNQDYSNFEIIIVNDSPDFDYSEFENGGGIKDNRIRYFKNEINLGNNYSKNFALDKISDDSDYILYLDDDDWLDSECLNKAVETIKENPNFSWYVSNRSFEDGTKITKNKHNKIFISYVIDCLILKRFTGDATHIISSKYKKIKYSTKVKLTEEWFYFSQIPEKFFYYDFNSTYQNKHTNSNMTVFYNKNKKERLKNTYKLYRELFELKYFNFFIWFLYLPLRIGSIVFK